MLHGVVKVLHHFFFLSCFLNRSVLLCLCPVDTLHSVFTICMKWVLSERSSWNLWFDSSIRIISLISIYESKASFTALSYFHPLEVTQVYQKWQKKDSKPICSFFPLLLGHGVSFNYVKPNKAHLLLEAEMRNYNLNVCFLRCCVNDNRVRWNHLIYTIS